MALRLCCCERSGSVLRCKCFDKKKPYMYVNDVMDRVDSIQLITAFTGHLRNLMGVINHVVTSYLTYLLEEFLGYKYIHNITW